MFSENKLDIKIINSNEFLLRNKLNRSFLETLQPILFLKKILILSPFHIANNFITPNLKTYNAISFLVTLVYLMFYVYLFHTGSTNLYLVFYTYNGSLLLEHMIIYYIVLKSELLVKVIITIQEIDEALHTNMGQRFAENKKNVLNHCIYVVFCQISTAIVNVTIVSPGKWVYVFPILSRFFLDLDLIFFISLMDFLTESLKIICIKIQTMSDDEIVLRKIYLKFTLIIDVYKMIGDFYRIPIMSYLIQVVMRLLVYVAVLILFINHVELPPIVVYFEGVLVTVWGTKLFYIAYLLTSRCERFNDSLRDIKLACLLQLCGETKEPTHTVFYNILQSIAVRYHKISAWGGFDVDATLMLKLASLTLTYAFVLLQYTYIMV